MSLRYFNMGPWPFHVGVAIGRKSFDKEIKRLKLDPQKLESFSTLQVVAFTQRIVRDNHAQIVLMCFKDDIAENSIYKVAPLVAHESLHVVEFMRVLEDGEFLGSEAEAYLLQYLVSETLNFIYDAGVHHATEPSP